MEIDSGILRKIPKEQENQEKVILKNKNVLDISINAENKLLVENDFIQLKDLKQITIDFIDNGGGFDKNNNPCDWCNGKKLATSSDHPSKAFIAIQSSRRTNYETYISVLDIVLSANSHLRNKLSKKIYNLSYNELLHQHKTDFKNKDEWKAKIEQIREKYPLLVSDVENTN